MKRLLTFLTLLTVFIGVGWAGTVTFTSTEDGGDATITKGGVTINCTQSSSSYFQCFKSQTMTISSNYTITGIEITCTASGTNKYGPGCFGTVSPGSYTYSGTKGTWSGSATEISFTATLNQVRMTQIVVTYSSGSSSVATPTITLNPATGPYYEGSTVTATIACETTGATLSYSYDGSTWNSYTAPLTITETKTIHAKASLNGDEATAEKPVTFSPVLTSLVSVNALADNAHFKYGEQTVVMGANGKNMYIVMPDNTAGTLVYDAANSWSSDYTFGKVINSGWTGNKTTYYTKPEVADPSGFSLSGETAVVTPIEITSSDLTQANFGRYAVLKNVAVNTSGNIDGITIYKQFGDVFNGSAAGVYDVYGVIGWNSNAGQFLPLRYEAVTVTGSDYYLAGTFNSWNGQDDNYKFTNLGNGTYTLTGKDLPDDVEFQIVKDGTTWYGGQVGDPQNEQTYGINGTWHTTIPMTISQDNSSVKNYKMQVGGISNITINTATMQFAVEKETPQFYIKCSDDWTNKISMTATNDGGWTITKELAANTQFGFDDEWNWYGGNGWWIREEHLGQELDLDNNNPFQMVEAGNYIITVNQAKTKVIVTKVEVPTGDVYTLVESTADLDANSEYVLFSKGGNNETGHVMSTTRQTNNIKGSTTETLVTNKQIVVPDDAQTITLESTTATVDGDEVDAWFISVGDGYLYAASNTANQMKVWSTTDDKCKATISINGAAEIIFRGDYSHRYLRYNTGDNLYSCYTSGSQNAVYLYKKTSSTPPTPTDQVATPVITPGSADSSNPYMVYGGKQQITITSATEGATIYYTTNGDTPTTSSTLYAEPCYLTSIGGNMTVKAIAVKDGLDNSEVATSYYRFTNPNPPTFNPASGTVHSEAFDVTISSEYNDAVIYYMLDPESEPTAAIMSTNGTVYDNNSPVNVSGDGSHIIYAMVIRNDIKSDVVNATYTITSGGQPSGDGDYVKVTSDDDLTNGDYLIVYEQEGAARKYGYLFNGALTTLDAVGNTYAGEDDLGVDIVDNTIASSTEVDQAIFTIDVTAGTIKSYSGYYIYIDSNNNGLKQSETVPEHANAISIDSDGNAVIVNNSAHLRYNAASNQDRFRYYKASSYANQQPIALYKKVDKPVEEPTEATLAQIITLGDEADGKLYKISNEDGLLGVYSQGQSVWFKDEYPEQAVDYQDPLENTNYKYYTVVEDALEINKSEKDFDQSNWIEVVFQDNASYNNKYVKNLTGTYSWQNGNPKLTLTVDVDETNDVTDVQVGALAYDLNPYMAANFAGTQDGTIQGETHTYFFSKPKAQEYAQILWAVWDGSKFNMPTTNNAYGFTGSFTVSDELNGGVSLDGLQQGETYNFKAVIRKTASKAGSYEVYPTDLNPGVVTGVGMINVNGNVKSVKYVNVAGIVSDVPFQGVNIVVTEYTDGSRTTTKMLKK